MRCHPVFFLRGPAILFAAACLAGCMVGPDFAPPAAPLAAAWAAQPQSVTSPGPVVDTAWWRGFDDPQLTSLIDGAARQNLSVQRAGVRVLQARAQLAATVGEYYPQQQQAFGYYLARRSEAADTPLVPDGSRRFNLARGGITASWELDFWGRFRRAIEAADAGLMVSVAEYDMAMVSLLGDVAATYVGLRGVEARLAVVAANAVLQRESLRIALTRYRGGAVSERDPAQAAARLAETEAQLPALAVSAEQARNALAVLLGVPPSEFRGMLGTGAIPRPRLMVAAGIPADLLARRPDLRATLANASAESARVGVNQAQLYPAVSITGTFGVLSADVVGASVGHGARATQSYGFGPSVAWNILNWGQITNQVRAQDAVLQQALMGYQQAVLQAQREVEDGLAAFAGAQATAAALRRAVFSAQRAAAVAMVEYEQGQVDYTAVLTSQETLLRQQEALVGAQTGIAAALVAVYRALGGGWQIREGRPLVTEATRRQMALRTDWGPLLDYSDGPLVPPPSGGLLPRPTF